MTSKPADADIAVVERLYASVDNPAADKGELRNYFDESFIDFDRNPTAPPQLSDLEAHLAFFEELKRGFSDISHRLNLVAPLPDGKILVYWTFEGLHRANFFGAPASGVRARTNGIDIYSLRNGRITEQRHCEDVAGLMAQITQAA